MKKVKCENSGQETTATLVLIALFVFCCECKPLSLESQLDDCPNPSALTPCLCNSTSKVINCSNGISNANNIRYIFQDSSQLFPNSYNQSTSQHYFSHLIFEKSPVEQLLSKSFENFNFLAITIREHYYLTSMEVDTFSPSDSFTKVLKFDSNPNLGSSHGSVLSLFNAIKAFHVLETLIISKCGLAYIPSNAFRSQTPLTIQRLILIDNSIKVLFGNAFVDLPSLRFLTLSNNKINQLMSNSLNLKAKKCRPETAQGQVHYFIDLNANQIESHSFQPNSFDVNCPMELNLSNNSIRYLPESIFKPLFPHYTRILLFGNPVDCFNCNMTWLMKGHYCSSYNSTLKYESLIESICEPMILANFVNRCHPFLERIEMMDNVNRNNLSEMAYRYIEMYPDDFKETDRTLLQCPGQENGSNRSYSTNNCSFLAILSIAILLNLHRW